VIDIVDDEDDKAIVEASLAIAKKMKLKVIAEGVEEIEQQDFLKQNGCYIIQGYYYSPPIPTAKFTALLEDQPSLFQSNEQDRSEDRVTGKSERNWGRGLVRENDENTCEDKRARDGRGTD